MTPIQVPLQAGTVPQTVNRLRLVVAALLLGVVIFTAVAVFLVEKGSLEANPALADPLLAALAGLVVAAVVAWSLLRRATLRRLRAAGQAEPSRLLAALVSLTILGAALAEGVALFAAVTYLLTASPIALVTVAAAAFVLVRQAPSEVAVKRLLDQAGG